MGAANATPGCIRRKSICVLRQYRHLQRSKSYEPKSHALDAQRRGMVQPLNTQALEELITVANSMQLIVHSMRLSENHTI